MIRKGFLMIKNMHLLFYEFVILFHNSSDSYTLCWSCSLRNQGSTLAPVLQLPSEA